MSKANTLIDIGARPIDVDEAGSEATRFTNELGNWIKKQVPADLDDEAFAVVSASLMIALSRKIAECAVAFSEANSVSPDDVLAKVTKMVAENHAKALSTARGLFETKQ